MTRKITTVTEEFEKDGTLKTRVIETIEESENEYLHPLLYNGSPAQDYTKIICKTELKHNI